MFFFYRVSLILFQVREIRMQDFLDSLRRIRRSVPEDTLAKYFDWNQKYGDMSV